MKTLILLSLLILVSCSDDSFQKVERLESFRILAIEASAPELSPGGGSTLSLIISDVNGGGRIISGSYVSCIDPGIAFGAPVNCDHESPSPTNISINTATDGDLGPANLYTGFANATAAVTVPNTIFAGRSATDQFNGVGYITIFSFTVDGREVTAFKRVVATNRGTLNSNPTGSAILLNGAAISAAPAKDDKLILTSTSAAETYDYITAEGVTETRTEEYQVAWYVTQGKFDKPKAKITETVEYQGDAPTASSLVLAIVRDERGGVDVVRDVR